jgi:hypothetical protein
MIPSIEDILQMLLDQQINKQTALLWIDQHLENVSDSATDLRDHFAANAMQGIISGIGEEYLAEEKIASWAYKVADAMLKARKA